ncbi:hypothetical protein Q7P37_002681 [Cladosporium fusiforme]
MSTPRQRVFTATTTSTPGVTSSLLRRGSIPRQCAYVVHHSRRHSTQPKTHRPPYSIARSKRLYDQLRTIDGNPHITEDDKLRNSTRIFAELECANAWTEFDNFMRETLGGRIPPDGDYDFTRTNYLMGTRIADSQLTAYKLTFYAPMRDVGLWMRMAHLLRLAWVSLKFPVSMFQTIRNNTMRTA